MSGVIHRRVKDGKEVFKIWSSVVDAYTTYELTLEELEALLIEEATTRVKNRLQEDLIRLREFNTSSRMGEVFEPDSPWKR